MTGLRRRSARAVPSALLALVCAVLAAFPAVPGRDAVAVAPAIASLAVHHVDAAMVASRGDSSVARPHDAPAFDVAAAIDAGAPPVRPVAIGPLRYDASAVARVGLPGVRAPPTATT
ncbi:MAG TPA: hypothetical protein VGL21_09375 [Jatrophihabitantaceae bacterium]